MITRGTTPTVVLTVEDFSIAPTDEVHVYFSQNGKMRLEKVSPDVILNTEENKIKIPLSQEDTFALKVGELKMQFRLKTSEGTVVGSEPWYEEVDDIDDNDEVL